MANKLNKLITKTAESDLEQIWKHTFEVWGGEKLTEYFYDLDGTINRLCRFPKIGNLNKNLKQEIYSFPAKEHLIFYIYDSENLYVLRVLHKKTDYLNKFGRL